MSSDKIIIKGAREHNLKSIDLEIPRHKLVVITGLSGSGKSSLAFDTIYAEAERRYVESLSAYARQFLEQMEKPKVEYIEGLSPAISIEQRKPGANPRSTVGTVTEIYDYLRLLFARAGTPYCYRCGRKIEPQTVEQMVDRILKLPKGAKVEILAPLVRGRKGEYQSLFDQVRREGYVRVRVNGEVRDLGEEINLKKTKKHHIEVVVDRLIIKAGIRSRLADSLETTLKLSSGLALIVSDRKIGVRRQKIEFRIQNSEVRSQKVGKSKKPPPSLSSPSKGEGLGGREMLLSEQFSCPQCGISYGEIAPRMFSFNSPYGACSACDGLGTKMKIDPDLVIPDKGKSLLGGAIEAWRRGGRQLILYYRRMLRSLANHHNIDLNIPFEELSPKHQELVLYGCGGEERKSGRRSRKGSRRYRSEFEGVIPNLERRFRETESDYVKETILQFMSFLPCSSCKGARLKPESLAIKVGEKSIAEVTGLPVSQSQEFFARLRLSGEKKKIAREVIKEIRERLGFLNNVGLNYLTLDRATGTLSSGEAERIRLATQIGSGLVGVLYVLDEPSIGLHQRDNRRLLHTLMRLRDLGNTVLVVEHDEATIRLADFIIDLGPGAGSEGGWVVASGTLKDIINSSSSLTGQYLRGKLKIAIPEKRRSLTGNFLEIKGARENNLKGIDVKIPLGVFTCVTGVSGSGKSTLIEEILYKSLAQRLYRAREKPGEHDDLAGVENIDKVIVIDQAPIGRTPRSNPATYTGAFTFIRELFSRLPEARRRGYQPGRFSFNVKGGRCPACRGEGIIKIEMHFLPDIYVRCQGCKGKRYNEETLKVGYKGKNIAEVLDMVIEEALSFFKNIPRLKEILQTLYDVGLGYIKLGQSAPTLSGGEAQRVKLATELSRRGTGKTLYILDEPTTGLHFADIQRLLDVLSRLTEAGNSVLVIEHNLDVIKTADWIIDLGPEGGEEGGSIVAAGTPEEVARTPNSHTGYFLKKVLN